MFKCFVRSLFSDEGLAIYVKRRYREQLFSEIEFAKLSKFEEYFSSIAFKSKYKTSVNPMNVVNFVVTHLVHNEVENGYEICIDENMRYKGIPIIVLCKIIDQGTLDISGYPIFSETFKYFDELSNVMEDQFMEGL